MLDKAYHQKLLENKQAADERTSKKRANRVKKKGKRLKKMSEANSNEQVKKNSLTYDSESDQRESDNSENKK